MEEEDLRKLKLERQEKHRLKIIDKEIRKAEAKTEKQKAAEKRMADQAKESKAARDKKLAENSVKKEQELHSEKIAELEQQEKNRLKIIDKEIRKAEAKTEKQKAAEKRMADQAKESKAARDKKLAENSVKKEQELHSEKIAELAKNLEKLAQYREFKKISANQQMEKTIKEEEKRVVRKRDREKLERQQENQANLTYIQKLNDSRTLSEIMKSAVDFLQ